MKVEIGKKLKSIGQQFYLFKKKKLMYILNITKPETKRKKQKILWIDKH